MTSFTSYAVSIFLSLTLVSNFDICRANMFLGKVPIHFKSDLALEHSLLTQIEGTLGNEHRTFTEKRLAAIEKVIKPVYNAMPRNEFGNLGNAAASYVLFRTLLARHAWFVTGLEPFKAMSEWNASSPTVVIDQRVPEFVSGLFGTNLAKTGFGVHELAVLAGTLEHLVHKESLLRAQVSFESLNLTTDSTLGEEEVATVMDTYMAIYILGPLIKNLSSVSPAWVRVLRANATQLYPTFPETQQFLRDVQQSVAPKRDYFYFSDVAMLVEEVGDRYGRWQDKECRDLKDMLVEMEDRSAGGSGRVRLADFYNAALHDGKWQFSEKVDYLRQLGALDESMPENLRVIIPNYINGPSNCVASSSYYSVCCMNECDELFGHLEIKIAAPSASATEIISIVQDLPSTTTTSRRKLPEWLTHRLEEAAAHHGGRIPLHGRLMAQWMHFAYPRECAFPHLSGTTRPQTAENYVRENQADFAADKTEMSEHISKHVPYQKLAIGNKEVVAQLESPMWTLEEELVVYHHHVVDEQQVSFFRIAVRTCMCAAAFLSMTLALYRTIEGKVAIVRGDSYKHEKVFV